MVRRAVRPALLCVLIAAACADPVAPPAPPNIYIQTTSLPASIALSAALVPDSTGRPFAWLTFTNNGSADETITHGACSFAVLLYQGGDFSTPVWQSVPTEPYACIAVAFALQVPAGASRNVAVAALASSFSIPAPPSGLSRAFVALDTGKVVLVRAGDVRLP